MVGHFNIIASFFPHNLSTLLVQHALFSEPIHANRILIGLLLLRYSLTVAMVAQVIVVVLLGYHLPISTHFAGRYEGLTDKTTLCFLVVELLVDYNQSKCTIGELKHRLKRIRVESHHPTEEVIVKTPETSHHLSVNVIKPLIMASCAAVVMRDQLIVVTVVLTPASAHKMMLILQSRISNTVLKASPFRLIILNVRFGFTLLKC